MVLTVNTRSLLQRGGQSVPNIAAAATTNTTARAGHFVSYLSCHVTGPVYIKLLRFATFVILCMFCKSFE